MTICISASNNNSSNNDNSNDSEVKGGQFQAQINIIPYDISTMSAMGDLNTEEITNRVKETLLNNNIGQKLFGEAVLNLSQGTVSELLSKPKPWNTLSIKGREPYLRMYMWLNDLMRLEKLTEWKEEKNCKSLFCSVFFFSSFFRFVHLTVIGFVFYYFFFKRKKMSKSNGYKDLKFTLL